MLDIGDIMMLDVQLCFVLHCDNYKKTSQQQLLRGVDLPASQAHAEGLLLSLHLIKILCRSAHCYCGSSQLCHPPCSPLLGAVYLTATPHPSLFKG